MQWLPLSLLALPDFHEKSRDGGTFTLHSTTTVAPAYSWYSWTQCLANAEHSGKIARRVKQKMYLVEKQLLTLARPQKLGSRTHLKIHTFSTLPQQSCYVLYLYVCVLVYSYTCIYVHTLYWQLERSSCEHVPNPSPGESGELFHSSTVHQLFHQSRTTLNFLISTWRAFFEIGLGLKIL